MGLMAKLYQRLKQSSLFADPVAKAKAIAQVEAHANQNWNEAAYLALERVARKQPELSTNDVWRELGEEAKGTHDLRAMGPVMERGRLAGLITATDRIKLSEAGAGRWKVRVWLSAIFSIA